MKKSILSLSIVTMAMSLTASANYLDDNLKKDNWNGIEVVHLVDSSLPTYDISVYFGDGARSDRDGKFGETEMMFDQLSSGTKRYFQKDIVESLEFFGTSYGGSVTHEYSTFNVHGLVKDLTPSMKMVCHLFSDAVFPKKELAKTKTRKINGLQSFVTNHGALANHIFRLESLRTTEFFHPVSGTIRSIKNIKREDLVSRLNYFNKSVYKKIYVKGPKDMSALKNIVVNDCKWKGGIKRSDLKPVKNFVETKEDIIFVPVPKSNQAQVRVGRVMTTKEVHSKGQERRAFTAKFLGGGFTSRLIQKLRVEKGLTYSAGAYVSEQASYGRVGVNTFTKNETIIEMLNGIKEVLYNASSNIQKENFALSKSNIKGNYLLGLESTSDFLQGLMMFDHRKMSYEDIYKFSDRINEVSKEQLEKEISSLYDWDKQVVLIVGNKDLIKVLKKNGYKVKVKKYNSYLY